MSDDTKIFTVNAKDLLTETFSPRDYATLMEKKDKRAATVRDAVLESVQNLEPAQEPSFLTGDATTITTTDLKRIKELRHKIRDTGRLSLSDAERAEAVDLGIIK